jgi:hypothetical protein
MYAWNPLLPLQKKISETAKCQNFNLISLTVNDIIMKVSKYPIF